MIYINQVRLNRHTAQKNLRLDKVACTILAICWSQLTFLAYLKINVRNVLFQTLNYSYYVKINVK